MSFKIEFHKQAVKDFEKVKRNPSCAKIVKRLLTILESDPFRPPYESLVGNLAGLYSRRINKQHRLVYMVLKDQNLVRVVSMWSHYETI